jgi:LPXTG-site transpeptidase (sortase) family protein
MQVRRTSAIPRLRRPRLNRSQLVLKPEPWRQFPTRTKAELVSRLDNPRQLLSYLLILVGIVLCTYVSGTYVWMYVQQKMLLREWKQAQFNAPLTKLSIPRIQLEDVILEGASNHSLLLGPAHLSETAVPGRLGNSVIAGHRDTFFRHIHSLRYGDDIYILRSGNMFHYVVRSRKVVEPTDLSVLRPTKDGELTLITCYPTHAIGPAPERLIVVAKLVSKPEVSLASAADSEGSGHAVLDAKREGISSRVGAKLQYLLK